MPRFAQTSRIRRRLPPGDAVMARTRARVPARFAFPIADVRILSDRAVRLVEDDQGERVERELADREVVRDHLRGRDDDLGRLEERGPALGGDRARERQRFRCEERARRPERACCTTSGRVGAMNRTDAVGRAEEELGDDPQRDRGLSEARRKHDEGVAVDGGLGDRFAGRVGPRGPPGGCGDVRRSPSPGDPLDRADGPLLGRVYAETMLGAFLEALVAAASLVVLVFQGLALWLAAADATPGPRSESVDRHGPLPR